MGGIDTFCFILLLILCGVKHGHGEVIATQLIYAFFVFCPGMLAQILLEVKGSTVGTFRKIVMITAWYAVSASVLLNIFIIGYIILFVNCDGEESTTECKSGLGSKIGACLILMIGQAAVQVYLSMVATWYY